MQAGGRNGDIGLLYFNLRVEGGVYANDEWQGAEVVPSIPYFALVPDSRLATTGSDALCTSNVTGFMVKGVWYKYTATQNETIIVDTFGSYEAILEQDAEDIVISMDTLIVIAVEINGQIIEPDNPPGCYDGTLDDQFALPSQTPPINLQPGNEIYFHVGGDIDTDTVFVNFTRLSTGLDVNGDGRVTETDAVRVINDIGTSNAASDVDGSGTVTAADANAVIDGIGTTASSVAN